MVVGVAINRHNDDDGWLVAGDGFLFCGEIMLTVGGREVGRVVAVKNIN